MYPFRESGNISADPCFCVPFCCSERIVLTFGNLFLIRDMVFLWFMSCPNASNDLKCCSIVSNIARSEAVLFAPYGMPSSECNRCLQLIAYYHRFIWEYWWRIRNWHWSIPILQLTSKLRLPVLLSSNWTFQLTVRRDCYE